jgi:sortase A
MVNFWYRSRHSTTAHTLAAKVTATSVQPDSTEARAIQQAGDRLIIPSMLLDAALHTGKDARTLNKGLWLRPVGSTPDKGGNTVIAGHRFTYTNPHGTLYFLDKVHPDDKLAVYWHGKKYTYQVREVKIVPPTETSIEAPTSHSRLTIYTCTPLWNPIDRLVVIADEIKELP